MDRYDNWLEQLEALVCQTTLVSHRIPERQSAVYYHARFLVLEARTLAAHP
jgi:hypothetical protein